MVLYFSAHSQTRNSESSATNQRNESSLNARMEKRTCRQTHSSRAQDLPEMDPDQLFETVRDGNLSEAKDALSRVDVTWRHSQLKQSVLFFIAARQRRGSEILGRRAVRMGVALAEVDTNQQTPLFYAASRGNLPMVRFLLNLGFEVNFRDCWKETALFYAISNSHMDIVNVLVEHGASQLVKSKKLNKTPRELLKAKNQLVPDTRKRPRPSPTPPSPCPAALARSRLAIFEWQKEESATEPSVEKAEDHVVVESEDFFVSDAVKDCAKRLRRSEREFAVDHADLHAAQPWCEHLTVKEAAKLVGVPAEVTDEAEEKHIACIEELATGLNPKKFTLTAVSQRTKNVSGYVFAHFEGEEPRWHFRKL